MLLKVVVLLSVYQSSIVGNGNVFSINVMSFGTGVSMLVSERGSQSLWGREERYSIQEMDIQR